MNDAKLDHRLIEIERTLVRDDPTLAEGFARLDAPVPARHPHRRVVRTLAAVGLVLLFSGVVAASAWASLIGTATLASAGLLAERDERRYLRAVAIQSSRRQAPHRRVPEQRMPRPRLPNDAGGVRRTRRPARTRPNDRLLASSATSSPCHKTSHNAVDR
jgi:hypothetical protein